MSGAYIFPFWGVGPTDINRNWGKGWASGWNDRKAPKALPEGVRSGPHLRAQLGPGATPMWGPETKPPKLWVFTKLWALE